MKHVQRILAAATFGVVCSFGAIAQPACPNCGTVVDVKTVKKQGEASGAGAVIGGVAGGVLGHQVGSGRGNTVATVAGAAGGAYVDHQVEKEQKSKLQYVVHIKMDDGSNRTFTYANPTSYRAGDKVKIVDKKLVKQ